MTYLPIILIGAGYVALVVTAGWPGLVVAGLHIGILVGGTWLMERWRGPKR